MNRLPLMLAAVHVLAAPGWGNNSSGKAAGTKSRTFLFTYRATVAGLREGQAARVWLPVPPSNEDQAVGTVRQDLPAGAAVGKEPEYGNAMIYTEARAGADGTVPLAVTYRVRRNEVKGEGANAVPAANPADAAADDARSVRRFLQPDARVPLGGKPMKLLEGLALPDDPTRMARVLYDVVDARLTYGKEKPGWGNGDADWACESGSGNCTDFHSLFISLARTNHLPAKFEIGFPLPPNRGRGEIPGYHCWAKFKPPGRGWVPVDISEANRHPELKEYYFGNLTEDRVAFSTGRDLILEPKQAGPPLNYFVYPYVEVDGKPYPAEKVARKFEYEDAEGGR